MHEQARVAFGKSEKEENVGTSIMTEKSIHIVTKGSSMAFLVCELTFPQKKVTFCVERYGFGELAC